MPRLTSFAICTPSGDLSATFAALLAASGAPGRLSGALQDDLLAVARSALAGAPADLVLLASTKGDADAHAAALVDGGESSGSPAALARFLAEHLGCPAVVVGAACASGPLAVMVGARRLLAGAAKRVLVLAGDRGGEFVAAGFASLKAIDPTGCHPYDAARAGLVLGEAVAAVVLEAGEGEGVYLQGWGAAMDANHLTAPARDGAGLATACRSALRRAGAGAPALVIGHGTGTRYNDDAETLALQAVCRKAPVTGFKGMLGHGLGASGLVDLVLAATCLQRCETPGTVGLRAQGVAGGVTVLMPGRHTLEPGVVMTASAGFAGLNASLVLGVDAVRNRTRRKAHCTARVDLDAEGWRRTIASDAQGRWQQRDGDQPRLAAVEVLGRVDPTWGRLDLSCRALMALATRLGVPLPPETGVVLWSETGCAASDRIFEVSRRAGEADPQRFPYTLPTAAVGELSIRMKLHGPGLHLANCDEAFARAVAADLVGDNAPAVLLARVEVDVQPVAAWAELLVTG